MARAVGLLFILVAVLFCAQTAMAQTYDLQFVVVNNDGVNFDVKVQIKAVGSVFALGSSNLYFDFNTADLSNPTIQTTHNFGGGAYDAVTTTGSGGSLMVLNFVLNVANTGTSVSTSWTDMVTVRFTTLDATGNANLVWSTGNILVYDDDEITEMGQGTFTNLNTSPLPIQLASFTAAAQKQTGTIVLNWSTASETNNYGFEVQKSLDTSDVYETIENSFIEGHGTTVDAHSYMFTDITVKPGVWYYRLKQTDLDGTIHYSDRILPNGVTGVTERALPTVFALDQNYPNPFNPATMIDFALPKESHVRLEVYNVLGQRVAMLADEVRQAGYYSINFNASHLASGLYLYRIAAGEVVMVKKMMLTK